jgi:hypothetical protein
MPLVKINSGGDDQNKADVEMQNVRLLLSDILLSPRPTLTRRPLFPDTKCLLQVTYPLLENMSISKVSLVPVVLPHTSQNGYIQDPIHKRSQLRMMNKQYREIMQKVSAPCSLN